MRSEKDSKIKTLIVKTHRTHEGKTILVVCDKDILGKTFEEGQKILNLDSDFYKGNEVSEEKVLELLKKVGNVNIVGEDSVGIAVKNGLVESDAVKKIGGIPYCYLVEGQC